MPTPPPPPMNESAEGTHGLLPDPSGTGTSELARSAPPRTTEQPGAVSQGCSDLELSAAVAALYGWRRSKFSSDRWIPPEEKMDPPMMWWNYPPSFATSADAVLPLLEKAFVAFQWNASDGCFGYLPKAHPRWEHVFASIPLEQGAFARAGSFALLRAARSTPAPDAAGKATSPAL